MTGKKILIITGTTATGKTGLAVDLARKHGGEIVSADSRQSYRHLDIITGKDAEGGSFTRVKKAGSFDLGFYKIGSTPVWLYDAVSPREYFSAFDWAGLARIAVGLIEGKGRLPVIAGGTYFYIDTLLTGPSEAGVAPDWELRRRLGKVSLGKLQEMLAGLNPDRLGLLNESDRQNRRRLIRWIEKEIRSPKSKIQRKAKPLSDQYDLTWIGLKYADKEKLWEAIKARVEKRLAEGAVAEVETLLSMGYRRDDFGLQTIGYQEIIKYLSGETDLTGAVGEWTRREVQYAKRQFTFMKRNPRIVWYEVDRTPLREIANMVY